MSDILIWKDESQVTFRTEADDDDVLKEAINTAQSLRKVRRTSVWSSGPDLFLLP